MSQRDNMQSLVSSAIVVYALAVVVIVVLTILHPGDNTTMIGHVVLLATTALGIIRSTQNSQQLTRNSQRLDDLHDAVNGRNDELMAAARAVSRAEGEQAGRQAAEDEANGRAAR